MPIRSLLTEDILISAFAKLKFNYGTCGVPSDSAEKMGLDEYNTIDGTPNYLIKVTSGFC